MLRHKIYKCRTRVILFSLGENSKHLRNYKNGRVIHGSRSLIDIILKKGANNIKIILTFTRCLLQ
jgi:hypothetical protein